MLLPLLPAPAPSHPSSARVLRVGRLAGTLQPPPPPPPRRVRYPLVWGGSWGWGSAFPLREGGENGGLGSVTPPPRSRLSLPPVAGHGPSPGPCGRRWPVLLSYEVLRRASKNNACVSIYITRVYVDTCIYRDVCVYIYVRRCTYRARYPRGVHAVAAAGAPVPRQAVPFGPHNHLGSLGLNVLTPPGRETGAC